MKSTNYLALVALLLVVIGAINWALIGLFDFNLVTYLFGLYTPMSRVIYTLVGLSGLYIAYYYDRFTA